MQDYEKILSQMKAKWQHRHPGYLSRITHGQSAVFIPIVMTDDEPAILYEVRAATLHHQPNEVSFPGGGIEAGETPETAAIRETCEELLVKPAQIEMIAPLDGENGPTGAPIWPHIGVLHDYKGTFSTDEVDHVFTVPVSWLLNTKPDRYWTTLVTVPDDDFPFDLIPGGKNYPFRKKRHQILFYKRPEAVIWGVTAQLTYSAVTLFKKEILSQS